MIMLRDKKTSAEKSYWLPLPLPQFFTPLQQCRYTNKTLSTCNWDVKYVNSLYLVLSFIVNTIWLDMHPSKLIYGTIYLVLNCIFLNMRWIYFYDKHEANFVQIVIFVSFARQMIACLLSLKVFFYIIISRSHLKPSKNLYMSIRRVNKTFNFFPSSCYFRGLCNIH